MTAKNYIKLNEHGFCPNEGWLKVYHYHAQTGEFIRASEEFRPAGVGLPANATDIKPLPEKKSFAICFNGEMWDYLPDHRDTVVYDIRSGEAKTIDLPGEITEQYTTLAPNNEFDRWNGKQWQTDLAAQRKAAIEQAQQQKLEFDNNAQQQIALLQDALDLDIALDGDKEKLLAWRKYRVILNRVDISATDVCWPEQPK